MTQPSGRAVHVLVIEDNPADADLAREMFEEGSIDLEFSFVSDGVEAMDFLLRRGAYHDVRRPELILLDLNLPKMGGREVIERVRADRSLRSIPIIVLSSSDAEQDVLASYDLGANCYVKKPFDLALFHLAARQIERFWLSVVKLPPPVDPGTERGSHA